MVLLRRREVRGVVRPVSGRTAVPIGRGAAQVAGEEGKGSVTRPGARRPQTGHSVRRLTCTRGVAPAAPSALAPRGAVSRAGDGSVREWTGVTRAEDGAY
ncbi:hypothetical protein SCA03_47190 [Streptomyces cacaoi]|uniref:Uncharacterized protein n=1 Tax=Streptomyces cacaoi TaxID=1898 RepID=A0A4Y3R600_STRCI|nr:hypothetical protein SCA03_47190 [Streptomyces cacaoi]